MKCLGRIGGQPLEGGLGWGDGRRFGAIRVNNGYIDRTTAGREVGWSGHQVGLGWKGQEELEVESGWGMKQGIEHASSKEHLERRLRGTLLTADC